MSCSLHVTYGVLSGLLLLCTILLSTIGNNHNFVFAQITPAPGKLASDASSPNSSTNNNYDGGSGSTDSSSSNNDNDEQGTTSTEQDGTTERHGQGITPTQQDDTKEEGQITDDQGATLTEQDHTTEEPSMEHEQTNPLAEEIMNKVDKILSAAGITGPAF
jgi:hypothetical protein